MSVQTLTLTVMANFIEIKFNKNHFILKKLYLNNADSYSKKIKKKGGVIYTFITHSYIISLSILK